MFDNNGISIDDGERGIEKDEMHNLSDANDGDWVRVYQGQMTSNICIANASM